MNVIMYASYYNEPSNDNRVALSLWIYLATSHLYLTHAPEHNDTILKFQLTLSVLKHQNLI